MTFTIGNQTAGVINNVAGDQRVTGGQHGTVAGLESARQAAEELRRAVLQVPLEQATARVAGLRARGRAGSRRAGRCSGSSRCWPDTARC